MLPPKERKEFMQQIEPTLSAFAPISLEEMGRVKLMNRIDTKQVIPLSQLIPLLQVAASDYYVQRIDGKGTAAYHTVYYDTADKRMYTMHETGRQVRQKIRVRTYLETGTTYLEIKNKNNHGRTKKKRIEVPGQEGLATLPEAQDFIDSKSWFTMDQLTPHVENFFERITLVNKQMTERLTIDLGIRFHNFDTDANADIGHLVIVELKRDGLTHSPMQEIFHQMRIHPGGFSKYCIGCALTNPDLRRNNLKEKLHRIEKLREATEALCLP